MRSVLVALMLTACGGAEDNDNGDGGSEGGGSCSAVALCDAVGVSAFAGSCAIEATMATPTHNEYAGIVVDNCAYGTAGESELDCFEDGAAAATLFFDGEHDANQGGQTMLEDLAGVGDKAFFRQTPAIGEAEVYILMGDRIGLARDSDATDTAATKSCLTDVAQAVVAAG